MQYKDYTFKYPKLTRISKGATDEITFSNCDFQAVDNIKLSGFATVDFDGYRTFFRKPIKIEINNCKKVTFDKISFGIGFSAKETTLIISDANIVQFRYLDTTKDMNLQTQNCGIIRYDISSLNFDTSKMNAKEFVLRGSQISSLKTLDLTGVTEKLKIYTTNVFDLQEMLIRPQVMLYIDECYDTKKILQPITRFQETKER